MYNHIWFPNNLLRNTFDSHKKKFSRELNIWNVANFLNQVCRAILGGQEGQLCFTQAPTHWPITEVLSLESWSGLSKQICRD